MQQQAPGRGLLKVTGILYIVLSVIGFIGVLGVLLGGGLLAATGTGLGMALGIMAFLSVIVALAQSVFGLIMGIMGTKYCDVLEKAGTCFVMGMIVTVLGVISFLGDLMNDPGFATLLGGALGLAIPVLYTLGAYKNKQAFLGL